MLLAAAAAALAADTAPPPIPPPWRLSADRIEHRRADQRLEAEGEVILERLRPGLPPVTITADRLRHLLDTNVVEAEGHVTVTGGGPRLSASRVRLDLDQETGVIEDASIFVPETRFYFTGKRVEKTGPLSYRFENGSVSACPAGEDGNRAWRIDARRAELTLEGYARLHGAVLRIRELPVLYTPYLLLPAKTVRATGFLFPELSSSARDGSGVIAPFFVNVSPSADLTLYPGFLERRGPFAGLEARSVLSRDSRLVLRASFLHDTKPDTPGDDFLDDGYLRDRRDRYWLRGKADLRLAPGLTLATDLDLVSDRDLLREYRHPPLGSDEDQRLFSRDFHRDLQPVSLPWRETSARLRRERSWGILGIETLAVKDAWDEPRAATPVQLLPRLLAAGSLVAREHRLFLAWDAEALHAWRREGVGGLRLNLAPRLAARLPLWPWLDNQLSLGLRHTSYRVATFGKAAWQDAATPSRTAVRFGLGLAVPLRRAFHPRGMFGWQRLVHLLRPELAYHYQAASGQDAVPQLDGTDRLEGENLLEYGIDNLLRIRDSTAAERRLGRLRLRQWYDIATARHAPAATGRHPFSDILVELELHPTPASQLRYQTTVSVHGQGVTGYDLSTGWQGGDNGYFRLDYRYQRDPNRAFPYRYLTAATRSSAYLGLAGGGWLRPDLRLEGDLSRSLDSARTVHSNLRLSYRPSCWNMELELSHGAGESRLVLRFGLEGLGRIPSIGLFGK